MTALCIRGGRVVDPASGFDGSADVRLRDGRVVEVGPALAARADEEVLDATGCVVAPGFIDLQCHLGDADHDDAETLDTLGAAAAAGGFTTVCCLREGDPCVDDAAAVVALRERAATEARVRVLPVGAITRGREGTELAELGAMAEAGAVAFADGRAIRSARVLRHALSYSRITGRPVVEHACDPDLAQGGLAHEGVVATRLGLPGIPAAAEEIAVARAIALARATGGRLHLGALSTAAALEQVRAAQAAGVSVTAAVAAHHLLLDETAVAAGPSGWPYVTSTKLLPPLRTAADRTALCAGVADGTLVVISDHWPRRSIEKDCEYAYAAPGASALESVLGVLLELVARRELPLDAALRALTAGPAAAFGLEAGRLAPGGPADLVMFDPEPRWLVDPTRWRSRGRSTPLAGHWLRGRVLATVVAGKIVYREQP